MIFLDTNILLYSISTAAAEQAKRATAIELLERTDVVLSVQVLQEFYVQSTRPTRSNPLDHSLAEGLAETWLRFEVVPADISLYQRALTLKARYQWSYWDAAIVAAALQAECTELLSEDLQHGQQVGLLTITNPFV